MENRWAAFAIAILHFTVLSSMIVARQWYQLGRLGRGRHNVSLNFVSSLTTTHISEIDAFGFTNNDLADHIRPYFEKQTPVVLRRAVVSSRAFHHWSTDIASATWVNKLAKNQQAYVELGGAYSESNAGRAEIPIEYYLQYLKLFEERHGRQGPDDPWEQPTAIHRDEVLYLAQNDLPDALQSDIDIPDFCQNETYRVGHGRLYSVMLWLGPRTCVSPLHFDPLDNVLMQFVGRKAVWLFDPKPNGMWHYAGHEDQQYNTSPVNPEAVDTVKYPRFVQEGPPAVRCVLNPGDMLYIPSKWWHFVRSVDTSASVNVWWR